MLCYSWDRLEEKERIAVNTDGLIEQVDLFAKILINTTRVLFKKGVNKNYIYHRDEINGVKGKIAIADTLKSNLIQKQITICQFDEFSVNILPNQILLASINLLIKTAKLDEDLKSELVRIRRMFIQINTIQLSNSLFSKVKIHRNNRIYGFILDVCQIIYNSILPSEQTGHYLFSDFTRDENKMNMVFESFIRNFYRLEQNEFTSVRREGISWCFEEKNIGDKNFLPTMMTDITMESKERKIIIDAKYYRETLATHFNQKKIHSSNLYQIFSYLMNQQNEYSKTKMATGILLYPTTSREFNLVFKYQEHDICIKTLNLNQDWRKISERLLNIIG